MHFPGIKQTHIPLLHICNFSVYKYDTPENSLANRLVQENNEILIQTKIKPRAVQGSLGPWQHSLCLGNSISPARRRVWPGGGEQVLPTTEAAAVADSVLAGQLASSPADPQEGGCSWDPLRECQTPASGSLE